MSRQVLGAFRPGNGALEKATKSIIASNSQYHQHLHHQHLQHLQHHSSRTFTSTTSRHAKNIAHFTPASSPELNTLLNDIRYKIILPSYLPEDQRKRIWSPKYEKKLQSDPIVIEIDGEVHKFRHMNRMSDVPPARKSLVQAVKQFQTPEDFANLRPLLEGTYYAGYSLDVKYRSQIARLCGIKDQIYAVLECARRVRTTGFKLDSSEIVNEIMHFIQLRAIDDPDPATIGQCLRWAQMVINMLAEDQHQPPVPRDDEHIIEGVLPLDRDPMVLLARLHLAATLAKAVPRPSSEPELAEEEAEAEGEGEGEGDSAEESARARAARDINHEDPYYRARAQTRVYAEQIVRLWPRDAPLRHCYPRELYHGKDQPMAYLGGNNKFIALATPLVRGLNFAISVLPKQRLSKMLRMRRDVLAAEIQEARKECKVPDKPDGRGERMFQKLNGGRKS